VALSVTTLDKKLAEAWSRAGNSGQALETMRALADAGIPSAS